jgi:para-aminobenzoate synthetase component 1
MSKLHEILEGHPFVFYSPGPGPHKQGFENLLLTGSTRLNTLAEVELCFNNTCEIVAAGLLSYNDYLDSDTNTSFIPFRPVEMFRVEKLWSPYSIQISDKSNFYNPIKASPVIDKKGYIETIELLRNHIIRGDIYEINYCFEFRAHNVRLEPLSFFKKLYFVTKAPFSCLYKNENKFIFSASPERFLKRNDNHLISQPIKGTMPRGRTKEEDEFLRKNLFNSEKERSENVMIVDLVRNDLSRIAERGTVKVDELFGIYEFETVNQMISTISCALKKGIRLEDIFLSTFPMGSMTGAPKISAMKLIRKYEKMIRGAYSGSLGYFTGTGNFDLNVVIRSIVYDSKEETLSFSVGSAITHKCNAEDEYNECMLKASALLWALEL